MVHDEIKAAARRRMAQTGEPFRVSPGCSVCRGDFRDGGPGGGPVDGVLAGTGGRDQGGEADFVDGPGLAAGGLVDLGDGVVGEEVGGAACCLEAPPEALKRRHCQLGDRDSGGFVSVEPGNELDLSAPGAVGAGCLVLCASGPCLERCFVREPDEGKMRDVRAFRDHRHLGIEG
jgi:hypothetical protein